MERASSNLSLLSSHLNPQFQSNQVSKLKPVDDVWESLKMDSYLTPEKVELRKKTRAFMESIEKELHDYINKTEFPFHLVPKIAQLGINGLQMKEFGAPGLTSVETGAILFEMAKVDMSVTTFLMVHNCIGMSVVEFLGDDEQKNRILPDCQALKKVICFGLTEPDYGSDASSLRSSAKKVEGGYLLNGKKRWIGNATFADYIIIWARNEADGNRIQAFVVEKGSKGLKTEKIENKYALRMTQNADITLDNVFVPDNNKLAKAKDYSSANLILEHSRVGVAWTATANAVGAYEASLRYVMQRKQFGKQIAAFQATQLKLSKMLGQCELMLSLCMRLSQLVDQGKTTIGQIGRTKGICSAIGREVCATAREICGGNGILLEDRVIKSMLDAEVIYTYEGTYEVNMLVSGREITGGISAFK